MQGGRAQNWYRAFGKRGLDIAAGSVLLALLSPVCLLAAVAVLAEDGAPIFFLQRRAGRKGRPFSLLKFRSMRNHAETADAMGQVKGDHELVTRTGRIIRRLKIDEVPQLVNVVKGEMSLVGPRPTLEGQVEEYDDFQRERLDERPGMTGWAQVNGNIQLSWEERIVLDVWYVHHLTLRLDLAILWRTVMVVLRGERRNEEQLTRAQAYAGSCHRSSR